MIRRHVVVAAAAVSLVVGACGAAGPVSSAPGTASSASATQATTGASPAAGSAASQTARASTSAAADGFRVVSVDVTADPANITGVCPVKVIFNGRITVAGGAGVVSFTWVSSDGDVSAVDTVSFAGPGTQDVSSNWILDAAQVPSGAGWSSLKITDPVGASGEGASSSHASFAFACDDSGFETIGFGLGGSDADCTVAVPSSTFATTDPIRVVADYSPPLQAGTIVTLKLSRDGVMVDGYPVEITLDESTKCVHGSVSPGVLPAGHYHLDIVPDTSRPVSGEFDTK